MSFRSKITLNKFFGHKISPILIIGKIIKSA